MAGIALAGLRGTLVEQVAALVAARTGWRIVYPKAAGDSGKASIYLGWESLAPGGPGVGLKVLLVAPLEIRLKRIASESGLDEVQAAGVAASEEWREDERARGQGWDSCEDPRRVHLVLNTGQLSPEQAASLIASAAGAVGIAGARRRRRVRRHPAGGPRQAGGHGGPADASVAQPSAPAQGPVPVVIPSGSMAGPAPVHHPRPPGERPAFAHPSEEEFARMLDFYRVEWQYEPTTFPLEWDEKGNVTLAFTPDFYIPAWNLYVELTTMKQSLVNRKNRKIRRLKELYPDVNIKVFYGRDFERLLRKYGREDRLAGGPPAPAHEPAGEPSASSPAALVTVEPAGDGAAAAEQVRAGLAEPAAAGPEASEDGTPGEVGRSRSDAGAAGTQGRAASRRTARPRRRPSRRRPRQETGAGPTGGPAEAVTGAQP